MPPAFCPHCLLSVANDVEVGFPPRPMRCPHCRLTIAARRARHEVPEGQVASGSAAGVMASAARRADGEQVPDDVVDRALERAARTVGTRVQRLRMIDYQRVCEGDMPELATILERYGSWKAARTAVARHLADGRPPVGLTGQLPTVRRSAATEIAAATSARKNNPNPVAPTSAVTNSTADARLKPPEARVRA